MWAGRGDSLLGFGVGGLDGHTGEGADEAGERRNCAGDVYIVSVHVTTVEVS